MSEISSGVEGKDNRLRVKDAFKDDSGQGRIRIDAEVVKKLKLKNGDAIEISNPILKLKTAALLFPSKPEDTERHLAELCQSQYLQVYLEITMQQFLILK